MILKNNFKVGFLFLLVLTSSAYATNYRHFYNGSGVSWDIDATDSKTGNFYIQCPEGGPEVKNGKVTISPGMTCWTKATTTGGSHYTNLKIARSNPVSGENWCVYELATSGFNGHGNTGPGLNLNRYPINGGNWTSTGRFDSTVTYGTAGGDISFIGDYPCQGGSSGGPKRIY